MDSQFIGSVINALPLEHMIGGPLQAMIKAQVQASKSYTDFLLSVCIKDGKAVAIEFDYDETVVDEQGVNKGSVTRKMSIPLLAAITHPIICIEDGTIVEASVGWGVFKAKMTGKVSHKSEQTRSTDTRAKYSIHTQIKRQEPPEALQRVIDYLTNAKTKPVAAQ